LLEMNGAGLLEFEDKLQSDFLRLTIGIINLARRHRENRPEEIWPFLKEQILQLRKQHNDDTLPFFDQDPTEEENWPGGIAEQGKAQTRARIIQAEELATQPQQSPTVPGQQPVAAKRNKSVAASEPAAHEPSEEQMRALRARYGGDVRR